MNGAVHYGLTKKWALEEGFAEEDAEAVARADVLVDRVHTGNDWRNWGWHFAGLGAHRRAKRLLRQAIADRDLVSLGESLHCLQDAIGHGVHGHFRHWNGIDIWERRGEGVRNRIERETRAYLSAYLQSR